MPRKKRIALTKDLKDKVLGYMSQGMSVSEMCKKDKTLPIPATIYNASTEDPDFAHKMTQGYTVLLMQSADELDYISTAPLSELYPSLEGKDAYEARRSRIDVLKFKLGKLAPILSSRFDKAAKVEHTGTVTNAITVTLDNYYMKPINTLEHD